MYSCYLVQVDKQVINIKQLKEIIDYKLSKLWYNLHKIRGDIPMIVDNNLPYKYVHSGLNYFAFSETEESEPYLCSCQKQSIINRIELFMKYYQYDLCLNDRDWLLLEKHLELPSILDNKIKKSELPYGLDWVELLHFKDNLCHLCNCTTPTTNHTGYIYATKLKQKYGHYINSHFYTNGIGNHLPDFYGIYFLEDKVPEDILLIIKPSKEEILMDIESFYNPSSENLLGIGKDLDNIWCLSEDVRDIVIYRQELSKYLRDNNYITSYDLIKTLKLREDTQEYLYTVIRKRYLSVKKIIVDEVKQSFKLKRWVNESLLANLISELFQGYTIYRNYRPQILEGLELDIYIQELKVGIEYQGVQHTKAVDLWGGEKGLEKRKEHDKRKAKLCKENNIDLIYFWHNEDINKELVRQKLSKYQD